MGNWRLNRLRRSHDEFHRPKRSNNLLCIGGCVYFWGQVSWLFLVFGQFPGRGYAEEIKEINAEADKLREAAKSDIGISKYMRENGYTDDPNVAPTKSEIAAFKEFFMPHLLSLADNISDPHSVTTEVINDIYDNISVMDAIKYDLGLLDFLFLFFGISTAFGMVRE